MSAEYKDKILIIDDNLIVIGRLNPHHERDILQTAHNLRSNIYWECESNNIPYRFVEAVPLPSDWRIDRGWSLEYGHEKVYIPENGDDEGGEADLHVTDDDKLVVDWITCLKVDGSVWEVPTLSWSHCPFCEIILEGSYPGSPVPGLCAIGTRSIKKRLSRVPQEVVDFIRVSGNEVYWDFEENIEKYNATIWKK